MAVAAYRNLLRSTRIAFQGDTRMLLASRQQARQKFEANRTLNPNSPECIAALQEAEGVSTILRQNVVQGASAGDGEKFKLRIHEETERGDNETIKKAGTGKVGGVKCCSS